MRITDLLAPEAIELGVSVASKPEAIEKLISLHDGAGNLNDVEVYREAILAREAGGTTAIGEGMAIPHAKTDAVAKPALAAITVPEGVDYEAPDGQPSKLIFMIAAPSDGEVHLEVLARLMTMLMDVDWRNQLLEAKSADEFLKLIDDKEREKFPEEEPAEEAAAAAAPAAAAAAADDAIRILAVTACPTGIAHTYMAAEALDQQAGKMGISIKVETNGSGGAKNILTKEEIAACEGIIVAADKNVEMARFDGKPVLITKVADGINKPEELINKVIEGKAPIYKHAGGAGEAAADSAENESVGRQVYKHLMEGVSHMLPFVVAGGIFIALAFLIDTIMGAPQDGNFGSNTPVAAWFKGIGGISFGFMLAILAGYIGRSIADRPGLLVGFVGGAMAAAGCTFTDPAGQAVSAGFLGALLAGFAGGYFMLWFEKVCEHIPQALDGMKPMLIFPLVGLPVHVRSQPDHDRHQRGHRQLPDQPWQCEDPARLAARWHDGHRHGRPDQQSRLPVRPRFDRTWQLRHDGRRHDRRHGSAAGHRACLHVLQGSLDRDRAQERSGQLHHGSVVHHRGCYPLCRS